MLSRRLFLRSAASFLAAPSIVRAGSIMPVYVPDFDVRAAVREALVDYWVRRDTADFIQYLCFDAAEFSKVAHFESGFGVITPA